jgi:long-chain acyl-CoA synthetase
VLSGPDVDGYPDVEIDPDDPATIVYTSGTTGSPKGAVHTHRNYCSGIMHNLLHTEVNRRELAARAAADPTNVPGPLARDCILLTYPLFHIAGLINLCLSMGGRPRKKLVLLHHWDPELATELILQERVTSALLVPTTLRTLLAAGGERLAAADGLVLRFVAAGGASVPGELIDRIAELFGGAVLPGNGYGLTETTAGCIAGAGAEYIAHPTSVGRPLPGMEIRIDADGDEAPVGGVGEILVRGPSVCAGYWQNPAETARNFTDGWFHTGDLGKVDEIGLYYVVDRIKDVIIRGGENIFCPEVEAVLETHPDVLEAAVFSLPDPEYGEVVGAVVRARPDTAPTAQQLRDFVGDRLAYFKVPASVVVIDAELPRTASGKVLKSTLRTLF